MARCKNGAVANQLRTLFHVGTVGELTDGQLLERFATGGGETAELAFAALLERHGPMVLRVCRSILADTHNSEDAFQATFLVLVKKLEDSGCATVWAPGSIRLPIAPHCAHVWPWRTGADMNMMRRCLRNEAQIVVHDDLAGVLHEEIDRLPERFRSPLILCDLEGRSHEQAARHLGWPVGTVKSRQSRGRERLRDRLRRRGLAPDAGVFFASLRPDGSSALVSSALVDSTIQSAFQLASSRVFNPGSAASLAQGVLISMNFARWMKLASVLLFLGATTSGVGLLAQKATQVAPPRAAANLQAARADEVPDLCGQARKAQCHRGREGQSGVRPE